MKPCRRCEAVLPLDAFSPNGRGPDGRHNVCRPCRAAEARTPARRAKARERDRAPERKAQRNARLAARWRADDAWRQREAARRQRLHQIARYGMTLAQLGDRDGWVCYLCGGDVASVDGAEGDHVVPVARGGSTGPENVRLTHGHCNRVKSDRLLSEVLPPPAMGVVVGASGYMLER